MNANKEILFELIKNHLINLKNNKVITNNQFYIALVNARKKLGLPVA